MELDEERWTVHRAGIPVELSPTEFRLLAYLMRHEGRVLTRAQLLENVWGWDYAGESQVVETYVSYLRRKLDPLGPPLIYTQRGVGYSFRPPPAMSGRRRLSLRARMLVLLIGVTTIFLLTMGTVSTVILARNVTAQFKSSLVAQASYSPDDVAAHPNGYAAVLVRRAAAAFQAPRVTTLTPASATAGRWPPRSRTCSSAAAAPAAPGLRRALQLRAPFTLNPPGGPRLLAMGRAVTNASTGGPGILVVAQPTSSATHQVRRFVIAELITGGALLALLAIGGEWLIGRGLDPLGKMASTAHDITTRGDLNARMPDPRDHTEVALLGSAINTMLDRIQQAFGARLRSEQKVREFAADASHELRTPLTTIRGYAELYRQGALGPTSCRTPCAGSSRRPSG